MFVTATLTNGVEDVMNPRYRRIDYERGSPQDQVVSALRHFWPTPPEHIEPLDAEADLYDGRLTDYLQGQQLPDTQAIPPPTPDKDNVDTPWRQRLLRFYNHLFYDIGNFLPGVNCALGHFHFPNHASFNLSYPLEQGIVKTFDTNVVILPAFWARDIQVKAKLLPRSEDEEVCEVGVWDAGRLTEAWFIRAGLEVEFTLSVQKAEGEAESATLEEDGRQGIAMVFAVGKLCTIDHDDGEEETSCCSMHHATGEEEEGEAEGATEGEVSKPE